MRMSETDQNLQKFKLFVSGFGVDQDFQEIRSFCERNGGEHIVYMTRVQKTGCVFVTYNDDESAANALKNLRDNGIRSNYAKHRRGFVGLKFKGSKYDSGRSTMSSVTTRPKSTQFIFENGEAIRIIQIENNFTFYAVSMKLNASYERIRADVNRLGATAEPLGDWIPKSADLILAPYEDKYYRALVVENVKEAEALVVYLVDIAKKLEINSVKLKKLPAEYSKDKFLVPFYLKGDEVFKENAYALECFKSMVNDNWELYGDDSEIVGRTHVELKNGSGHNLNNVLKQMVFSYSSDSLNAELPKNGSNKQLMVVDASILKDNGENCITFVADEQLEKFKKDRDSIQSCGKRMINFPAYFPGKSDEICFVRIDHLWYRAVIAQSDDEKDVDCQSESDEILMNLIDQRTQVSILKRNIRKINKKCAEFPVYTFYGTIDGFEGEIEGSKLKELTKKLDEDEMVVARTITKLDDELYSVELDI